MSNKDREKCVGFIVVNTKLSCIFHTDLKSEVILVLSKSQYQ